LAKRGSDPHEGDGGEHRDKSTHRNGRHHLAMVGDLYLPRRGKAATRPDRYLEIEVDDALIISEQVEL
jgi:hypothetical protein